VYCKLRWASSCEGTYGTDTRGQHGWSCGRWRSSWPTRSSGSRRRNVVSIGAWPSIGIAWRWARPSHCLALWKGASAQASHAPLGGGMGRPAPAASRYGIFHPKRRVAAGYGRRWPLGLAHQGQQGRESGGLCGGPREMRRLSSRHHTKRGSPHANRRILFALRPTGGAPRGS
jgi:hypothetical protein